MALITFVGLYAIAFFALGAFQVDQLSYAVRVAFALAFLFLPILVYSSIDRAMTRRAVSRVGRQWCAENDAEFLRVDQFSTHFSLVHRRERRQARQKFIAKFVLGTWTVKHVDWL